MYVLCSQMWWSSNLFLIATKFGSKILSGFQMLRFQLATTDSNITGPGVRHGCKTPISSSRWNRSHQLLGRWVWLIPMPCNTISINMTSTMYVIVKSGGLQRSFAVCLDFVGFRKDQMWFYIYYICNYLFVCLPLFVSSTSKGYMMWYMCQQHWWDVVAIRFWFQISVAQAIRRVTSFLISADPFVGIAQKVVTRHFVQSLAVLYYKMPILPGYSYFTYSMHV